MIKSDSENQKPAVKKVIYHSRDAEKVEALLGTLRGYSRKLESGPNEKAARGILRMRYLSYVFFVFKHCL